MGALGVHAGHEIERGVDRAEQRGRRGRGEDEARAGVDQPVAQPARSGDIGPERTERLGKGAHHAIDARDLRAQALAPRPEDAGGVGLVDMEESVVAAGERGERGDVGPVAVHRIDAFHQDQPRRGRRAVGGQQLVEMGQVVVAEAVLARASKSGVERGVDQPVGEHRRARGGGEQGGQHGGVGLPAAGEQQRGLGSLEGGDLGFEREVGRARAGHEARGAGPGSKAGGPLPGALGQQRMAGKAQIVVAGKVDQGSAVARDPAGGGGFGGAQITPLAARADPGQRAVQPLVEAAHLSRSSSLRPCSGGRARCWRAA